MSTKFFVLSLALVTSMIGARESSAEEPRGGAETQLSRKAASLQETKAEYTRGQVVALLGAPTWVLLVSDKHELGPQTGESPVLLLWDNGKKCGPVQVAVDTNEKVTGWDLGLSCDESLTKFVFSDLWKSKDRFSCLKKDRAKFCR